MLNLLLTGACRRGSAVVLILSVLALQSGANAGRPLFHAGLAHWLVPDRVQVDFTCGNRMQSGTDDRFFSAGLVLVSNTVTLKRLKE